MSDHEIHSFPPARKLIVDAGYLGTGRHIIYGLVEVDITGFREKLDQLSTQKGIKLSFTGFLVACLARAVAADPRVQSYRDWRGRLIVFKDVDVVTMIESKENKVAIPHIIRKAHQRDLGDISAEIRAVQTSPESSQQSGPLVRLAPLVPRFFRLLFFKMIKLNPQWFKNLQGTVILTSVGMFGKSGGWGVSFLPSHTLGLTVGGISAKPGVIGDRIEIRDYLNLTLAFDHDLVDGAPAARFSRTLIETIESGVVLDG